MLVELLDLYEIRSNRKSGYGRYDVMLIPNDTSKDAIIMEFKVLDDESEKKLSDTVEAAKRY